MRVKKLLIITAFTLLGLSLLASPILAITNPDDIDFGSGTLPLYKVFENVQETGDMLFVAEGLVEYANPADYAPYDACESYLFEILTTDGATTLLSTPLNDYGDRPISIYQTAAQVTAAGLVSGTAYGFRITGNPLIFPSPVGNSVTTYLTGEDYVDQLLGVDGGVASDNPLRNFLIIMAENIEAYDVIHIAGVAVGDYITPIQGIRYLTIDGGDIFLEGIPELGAFCLILFQAGLEPLEGDTPESTGAYALTLTPAQKWGQTVGNGLTALGDYLGINQMLAGSVVLFGLGLMFAAYVYKETDSGITVLLIIATLPFIGSYLGLMHIALAFIFTISISVLVGYFFFSRGAL